jgi:capsular exopolysaccharide synthesis family protein
MDYLNDEVRDLREFQSVVKAPFLGHVLYMPSDNVVAVDSHNNSAQAELFRTIRTNLRFMLPDKKSPILLVTSALNGEGKSYVAINIAASLALLKKKVVIVGLDIRKPTLSQYLHIDFKGHLTSFLLDPTMPLDDLIIPSGAVDNLDVMPSGAIPPNPGELIQSANVEVLFNALRERYDYIVVDTAPLYLVSDTFHLDKYADMTIFVTRANYISREMLPYIQDIYAGQKMHNMACVLNASTGGKRGYGYGRYGYGRYGYGRYGYGRYGYGHYGYGGYGYGYYGEKQKDS